MYDHMQTLSNKVLEKIHAASMELLEKTGIAFFDAQVLNLLRESGFKVENNTVFFSEQQIETAHFYKLPSRSGGGLCDAHLPDAQAGYESGMHLLTAVRNGVNFILHSCGQMAGHLAMSFEKFLIDEEFCGMLRKLIKPIEVNDDNLDVTTISEDGIGGQYLTHPKTFKLCRSEYFLPALFSHENHETWASAGCLRIDQRARKVLKNRLAEYRQPEIEPAIREKLIDHVTFRKNKKY